MNVKNIWQNHISMWPPCYVREAYFIHWLFGLGLHRCACGSLFLLPSWPWPKSWQDAIWTTASSFLSSQHTPPASCYKNISKGYRWITCTAHRFSESWLTNGSNRLRFYSANNLKVDVNACIRNTWDQQKESRGALLKLLREHLQPFPPLQTMA